MKRIVRNSAVAILLLSTLLLPHQAASQCTCSEGEAPTPIEHVVVLDTTNSSSTMLTFPKFDPSIGLLTCVSLHDTLSIVSTLGIRNLDPTDKVYQFRLTVTTGVTGAGLTRNNLAEEYYGPDLLGAFASGADSTTYGPDTLFNNRATETYVSNVTGFMGAGTVDLLYEIGGGVTSLAGGINFNSSIRTRTWGVFKLTYYWCPNIVLASNIKSFSAVHSSNRVNLLWDVVNEKPSTIYELQVSSNGKVFKPVTRLSATGGHHGQSSYQHAYVPDQAINGKLYFRIKQISADGEITYSVVRFVYGENPYGQDKITIYPNPLKGNQVSVQFARPLSGSYKVDLVNMAGQTIYSNVFRIRNTNSLLFEVPGAPPGIYYFRATNTAGSDAYTSKLMIQ